MPDAPSWEELARQFEELDPDGALVLVWRYEKSDDRYVFGYAWSEASVFIQAARDLPLSESSQRLIIAKFKAYGTRAGKKIGVLNDPIYRWLLEITTRSEAGGFGTEVSGGRESQVLHGRVYDLCRNAASLCYLLEADAETGAQKATALQAVVRSTSRGTSSIDDPITIERRSLIQQYKRVCKEQGVTVTDTSIAKAASSSWNDRTQVTWWKRNDPRCTSTADRLIRAVFTAKPHLPKKNKTTFPADTTTGLPDSCFAVYAMLRLKGFRGCNQCRLLFDPSRLGQRGKAKDPIQFPAKADRVQVEQRSANAEGVQRSGWTPSVQPHFLSSETR